MKKSAITLGKICICIIAIIELFLGGVAYTISNAKLEYHEDQQIITLEIFGEIHAYR